MTETVKIRGLARIPAGMFAAWGALVTLKGLWDLLGGGEPEANLYSAEPWQFVTREQWARYGFFEVVYGIALLGAAWLVIRFSRFLPETMTRPRQEEVSLLR